MAVGRYHEAYAHPNGPGDARPTALQIIKDEGLEGKMTDKIMLVTGASSGIGIETTRALHATGATIFIGVRNVKKGQEVVDEILASDPSNTAPIHIIEMSLDSFASVRTAAAELLKHSNKLNVLVLNAGVMATPEGRTVDGFETQFGTNYLGHFLLFQLLKPALLASSTPEFNSRVVSVASIGHRFGTIRFHDYNFEKDSYHPIAAYGQSKTANIYLANYIDRHYGLKGLHAISLHPGGIWSGLTRHMEDEELEQWKGLPNTNSYYKSSAQGAATSVYAAVSKEWEGTGGKYLSNCEVMGPFKGTVGEVGFGDDGYAPWAYNEENEDRLWSDSCKFVGVEED